MPREAGRRPGVLNMWYEQIIDADMKPHCDPATFPAAGLPVRGRWLCLVWAGFAVVVSGLFETNLTAAAIWLACTNFLF